MMHTNDDMQPYERLISRVLDGEASEHERAALNAAMARNRQVRALYETTRTLDAHLGAALRAALDPAGTPAPKTTPRPQNTLRRRLSRIAAIAAAACIAWLMASGPRQAPDAQVAEASSWFAPPPESADTLADPELFASIPAMRVRNARSGWLVVPTQDPNEYLVIEVARIREKRIPIELDY